MAQILVIEDNETMREAISQVLHRMGHDVRSATGGKMGISMFEESPPDFTITDLENLYREEGLSWKTQDQGGYAGKHVLEGGNSLVCPRPGSVGYARIFCQPHEPYVPRTPRARELAKWEPPNPTLKEIREQYGAPGLSDEEMLLRLEVSEDEIATMRAAGPPAEFPNADWPLVTLIEELAKRTDRSFISVNTGDLSITLQARAAR